MRVTVVGITIKTEKNKRRSLWPTPQRRKYHITIKQKDARVTIVAAGALGVRTQRGQWWLPG